ncbi:MAG: hypothetical protein KGK01_11970 [Bradyrhizobium sp.]|nr:hypothetical protein [Bradyrhizobium sp.]
MNRQEAGVEQRTEKVRDERIPSAAAEAFCSSCRRDISPGDDVFRRASSLVQNAGAIRAPQHAIGCKSSMHFGFYVMIAGLVLLGLEASYALYQLAALVM